MSDNIDPKLVEEACMADLSRLRQEELPLNTVKTRGPSFAPSGRNGTDHISRTFKQELSGKWSTKIDDEEAQQMEGLHVEDARPWAKMFTRNLIERGFVGASRTLRIVQPPPPKKAKVSHSNEPVIAQRQVQASITGWSQVMAKSDANRGQAPVPALAPAQPVTRASPPLSQLSAAAHGMSTSAMHTATQKRPFPHGEPTIAPPLQLSVGDADDGLMFNGFAQIVPGKRIENAFAIEFKVESSKNNEAYITLSTPDKGARVLNILDLEDVTMDDDFCLLKGKNGGHHYHIRLMDLTWTARFQDWMMRLQAIAKNQQAQQSKAEANVAPGPEISTEKAAEVDSSRSGAAPVASPPAVVPPTIASGNDGSSEDVHVAQAVEIQENQVEEPMAPITSNEQPLITLDDAQEIPIPHVDIEGIVNYLSELVGQVLQFMKPQNQPSSELIKGIEDAAIEFWTQQGFIDEIDDETRTHISGLVHSLVFFKTKMQLRAIGGHFSSLSALNKTSSEYSAELEREMTGTIRYSPKELEDLRPGQSPCPTEIESSGFLPRALPQAEEDQDQVLEHVAGSIPERPSQNVKACNEDYGKQIQEVTKNKDWLVRKDDQTKADKSSPKHTSIEPVAIEKVPIAHEKAPVAIEKVPVASEKTPAVSEKTPAVIEKTPVAIEKTPIKIEQTPIVIEKVPVASLQPKWSDDFKEYKLDEDLDTPMGNTEWAIRAEAQLRASASQAPREAVPNAERRLRPWVFGASAAPLDTSGMVPASAPAGRSVSRQGTKGLSASRYADKPTKFEGSFTGAS